MDARPLTVRDRPFSFWGGAVLLFFGLVLLVIQLFLSDRPRDRDIHEIVTMVAVAFLALGAAGCWRGRAARLEPSTKELYRGGEFVRDLSGARALVLDRLATNARAHYVYLVVGAARFDGEDLITIDQVRNRGFDYVALAQGVPPGMARSIARRWLEQFDVPVLRLPGCELEV